MNKRLHLCLINQNQYIMKNTQAYLEHANIAVKNLDETITFIQTALPDFKIRGGGNSEGRRWVHIGTDQSYLALNEVSNNNLNGKNYGIDGLNHLGFVVDDVAEVAERLQAKGYVRSYPHTAQKYRIRDYFLDNAGNEYEFVQYLSNKVEEKNDYSE